MSRPKLRHCKDCRFYRYVPKRLFYNILQRGSHWCLHDNEKNMSQKESRTCPEWCPLGKRKKYY